MTDLSKFVKPIDEPLIPGQDWNEFILQSLTPEARDTLSKLSAGTHVLVPVEPTEATIAAAELLFFGPEETPDGFDLDAAYISLIQAAQEGE